MSDNAEIFSNEIPGAKRIAAKLRKSPPPTEQETLPVKTKRPYVRKVKPVQTTTAMTYRILQHEKSTDNIRIGRAFEAAGATAESTVKAVTHALTTYHEIAPEEFGRYWSRIAIVDADTLAVIATIYNENGISKNQ